MSKITSDNPIKYSKHEEIFQRNLRIFDNEISRLAAELQQAMNLRSEYAKSLKEAGKIS